MNALYDAPYAHSISAINGPLCAGPPGYDRAPAKRGLMRHLQGRNRTVLLVRDDGLIPPTPLLRAAWGQLGEPINVPMSGDHERWGLDGPRSVQGARALDYAKQWDQDDFPVSLRPIRKRWRGWRSVRFLDRGSPHTARASRRLARALGSPMHWLPTACPARNPGDHLWRHVQALLANEPHPKVVAAVVRAADYVLKCASMARLRKAGVLAPNFWLKGLRPVC